MQPSNLIQVRDDDRYFDYCLEPYRPVSSPQGKLRSENLLWQSYACANSMETLGEATRVLQGAVGRDLTVFGVKWDGQALFWEWYFYDPEKTDANATLASVSRSVAQHIADIPPVPEAAPYFMASIELRASSGQPIQVSESNLYMAHELGQGGYSYRYLPGQKPELTNTYCFYDTQSEMAHILARVRRSICVDFSRVPLQKVLPPELFACRKICVAKKRFSDGIYFSGLRYWQFLWFLEHYEYPTDLVEFVRNHADQLDHLRYDVGIDYSEGDPGQLSTPKTSFYGVL